MVPISAQARADFPVLSYAVCVLGTALPPGGTLLPAQASRDDISWART